MLCNDEKFDKNKVLLLMSVSCLGTSSYLHELRGLPEFLSKLPFEHLCVYNQQSWLRQEACRPRKKITLPNLPPTMAFVN